MSHILHHAFKINEQTIRLFSKTIAFANIIKIEEKKETQHWLTTLINDSNKIGFSCP